MHDRHAHRCSAGRRADRDHRDAAAADVRSATGRRAHHACGHLLRCTVRRLDDGHSREHTGRGDIRRHHARWSPDGQAGPRWYRARHRCYRLVLRGYGCDAAHRGDRCPADQGRAAVRPGRLLLPHGSRPDVRRRARARLDLQGDRHDPARRSAVDCRHGPRDR